jgi:hypothetical protein
MSKTTEETITIKPLNNQYIKLTLEGTAPLMQAAFPAKVKQAMMSKMLAGPTASKGKKREARDFESDFLQAQHISTDGWVGVPASSLRNACIDVCRTAGFKMNFARMSIFVMADGHDKDSGYPLIKLDALPPEQTEMATRNATGVCDIRVRPMWRAWKLHVTFKYDADQFTASDIVNLISRAGEQIGIGEGRPYSKSSNGLGFGTFKIAQ